MKIAAVVSSVLTLLLAGNYVNAQIPNLEGGSKNIVSQTTFVCGQIEGVPTTIARTPQGIDVPIIRYVSGYFAESGYTNEYRCQEVSARFQRYASEGTLKYMATGKMNGYPVICVAETQGGSCGNRILITLKQNSDPRATLQALIDIRNNSGLVLNETGSRLYVDMEEFLQEEINASLPEENPQPESPGQLW